jgi:hypothetical protein
MRKPTARATEMKALLEEFSKSGQARRKFCEARGIALTTFDYWRRELGASPRLVKVKVARTAAPEFTLRFANGRAIDCSFSFVEEDLARLIRIAERA